MPSLKLRGHEDTTGPIPGLSSFFDEPTSRRPLVTRSDAIARAREARVGRMATITAEGRPHVVPFVFVLVGEGSDLRAFWAVDRKPKRGPRLKRIENLAANP